MKFHRFIDNLAIFLYEIFLTVFNFPTLTWYRLIGYYKKHDISAKIPTNTKYAIFNIYPGTSSKDSVIRVIDELTKYEYTILLIFPKNTLSQYWASEFAKFKNCVVINRPNVGYDFASYKLGIWLLEKESLYAGSQNILLINDSFLVGKKNIDLFSKILDPQSKYNCIFINRAPVFHAGAFLLKFDRKAINSSNFQEFWKKYRITNNKSLVIRNGEHKLSNILGIDYFNSPLDEIIEKHDLNQLKDSELLQLILWVERSQGEMAKTLAQFIQNGSIVEFLTFLYFNTHVSNAFGGYIARNIVSILKMDLTKLGLISLREFQSLLIEMGIEGEEFIFLTESLKFKESYYQKSLTFSISKLF